MDHKKFRKTSPKPAAPNFEVITGINYGDTRREAGEIVNDIPAESITWLLEQGAVKQVESEQ